VHTDPVLIDRQPADRQHRQHTAQVGLLVGERYAVVAAQQPAYLLAADILEDRQLGQVALAADVEPGDEPAGDVAERGEVVGENDVIARAREDELVWIERI